MVYSGCVCAPQELSPPTPICCKSIFSHTISCLRILPPCFLSILGLTCLISCSGKFQALTFRGCFPTTKIPSPEAFNKAHQRTSDFLWTNIRMKLLPDSSPIQINISRRFTIPIILVRTSSEPAHLIVFPLQHHPHTITRHFRQIFLFCFKKILHLYGSIRINGIDNGINRSLSL